MDPLALQSLLVGWMPVVRSSVALAYNVALVLGLALASLATMALARQLGLSRRGSILAAALYAAGPYAAGHYHHLNQLPTAGLPLIVLGLLRLHRGDGGGILWIGLGGSVQLLGGVYQAAALYLMLVCLLPTLWGVLSRRRALGLASWRWSAVSRVCVRSSCW